MFLYDFDPNIISVILEISKILKFKFETKILSINLIHKVINLIYENSNIDIVQLIFCSLMLSSKIYENV